ncbi:serine proteinase inhibitor [Cooperia oncophora]
MYLTAETDFGLNMLRKCARQRLSSRVANLRDFRFGDGAAGAKGTTKSQINSVISEKGASDNDIEEHYSKLSSQIMNASNGCPKLSETSSKQYSIEKDYENDIKRWYNAEVEVLDFAEAEQAAKIIDNFVSNTTEGKIQNIVNEQSVEGAYSLIVNAIYFTAKWQNEFSNRSNSNGTFYSASRKDRQIEFMNDIKVYRLYAEDNDLQVLSLQYKDTSFAFNIFYLEQGENTFPGRIIIIVNNL